MGFTRIDVDVANAADSSRRRTVSLLVDTGALVTVVPATVLDAIGIRPVGTRRYRGFGGSVDRRIGIAQFSYQEDIAGGTVIFGEPDDPPVLGVTVLEALGYIVDPVNRRIIPVESLML
ncbi:MAG: aspartyl protease family protein [Chloroflexi bacterium]|nr:aspartyl protease family protein [Chloroflexota bacterium]